MRKGRVLMIALTLILLASAVLVSAWAGDGVKTVYLCDGGDGDGASAESPLGDFKSAVRLLSKDGGRIVICGKYTYTELINLSEKSGTSNGKSVITVTSVDGQTDYRRTSDAAIVAGDGKTSANMILAGCFVFENLTLVANCGDTPRAIICGGYETTFGEGMVCRKQGNSPYLSIVGVSIDGDPKTSDGRVTVKSGAYNNVCAGSRNGTGTGDTSLTVDGGTFEGVVSASGYISGGIQKGNAVLTVNGGVFNGRVGCVTPLDGDFEMTVNGGTFKREIDALGKYNTVNVNGGELRNVTRVTFADYVEPPPETNANGRPIETKAEDVKKTTFNVNEYSGDVDKLIGKIVGNGVLINKNTLGGNDAETTVYETVTDTPEETAVQNLPDETEGEEETKGAPSRRYLLGTRKRTVIAISAIGAVIALSVVMLAYRAVYRKK